ncbi:MAG: hypothetical protein HXS52_06220 [Theionarchaea archaeon]|nr:hypothetical protein [Theionarchaea archaeon]MBU7037507.1 hypothetical protein [Theionarchaea archaeon]
MNIYWQALGFWIVLVLVAIVNGTLRNEVYGPAMEELHAHQISTVTGIIFSLLAMYVFFKLTAAHYTDSDLIMIGVMWLGLTVAFELLFGHFIVGHTWSRLLTDYNILKGRIWILMLLTTLLGPYIVGKYAV